MNIVPSFTRYLTAKKSVDDRALNRNVWDTFCRCLPRATPATPLTVLEVGAGIGTMIERLCERGVLTHTIYTAIDADATNIAELEQRVAQMQNIVVEPCVTEVFDFIAREHGRREWDVLIAHAFLDLLDISRALPKLLSVLKRNGILYATIVFDGATIFEPTIDADLDAQIEHLYHQVMDERLVKGKPAGDSRAGRHLFRLLAEAGVEILQAGSSDWVVYPTRHGYREDEAYFLHFIIDTLHKALECHPALVHKGDQFNAWIQTRHRQVAENQLVYIAHQIDLVATRFDASHSA